MPIFVTFSPLCIEYVKEQNFFTSILCTVYLECMSPMNCYFITDIRTKRVFLKKKSIISVGISNCYSKRAAICWEIGFSIRQSCGKPSFNATVKEPLKKCRMPTVPESSNNTRFDKLDHFPVFQEKQQRCRKIRTDYHFIKCQKCRVDLYLQKVRNCFTIYHTKR